jgi:hypothetical protein
MPFRLGGQPGQRRSAPRPPGARTAPALLSQPYVAGTGRRRATVTWLTVLRRGIAGRGPHVRSRSVTGVTRPCATTRAYSGFEMRFLVAGIVAPLLVVACSRSPVEDGLFFPTWSAEGAVPSGIVQGALVEANRCLYVERNDRRTLVAWEDGMGFEDGTLFATSGSPIARVGEVIHGGGGYYDGVLGRSHVEELSGESIPERCIPDGPTGDRFAVIYEVEPGPFE